MTTAGLACRPGGVRRLGRAVRGAALSGSCLSGVTAVGAVVSSRATIGAGFLPSRQAAPAMMPIPAPAPTPRVGQSVRVPVLWGLAFGAIQAASPLALWWLDQATVQALLLSLIAAVYIGFAVADGRPKVIAVESAVAGAFVLLAAAGVTGPAWLLVLGYAGHGLKDFWQERIHYVAGTGGGRRSAPPSTGSSPWFSPSRSLQEPDFITSQATGRRQSRVGFGTGT